jgi:hypothetical protein
MNCIRITKYHIVRYDFDQDKKPKTDRELANEINLADNEVKGELSKKARQRLIRCVSNILGALETGSKGAGELYKRNKHLPTFVTLTLSSKQVHTDEFIKRHMLARFIAILRDNNYCNGFVWKAEKQRNGNIHFHLLLPNYVPHDYIRKVWNHIQDDNGYIEEYRRIQKEKHKSGFYYDSKMEKKWTRVKQLEAYNYGMGTNWSNPNSTDIHSLRKVRNTTSYIAKYMGKKELDKKDKVSGRLWGRSDNVEQLQTPQSVVNELIANEIIALEGEDYLETTENDYCTIYRFRHSVVTDFTKTELYRIYKEQHESNFFILFTQQIRTDSIIT